MIDAESWLRVHQQEREREMQAAHRANLLRGPAGGVPRRSPTRPLARVVGRTIGRTLVRVGLWLIVAE